MEYIDVLDEKGNKTGAVKSKDEIHANGYWHKTVHIWFVNKNGQLLLQLRSKVKRTHPLCWDISAAGHVSAGEDALQAAVREIEEEIGIIVEKKDFVLLGTVLRQTVLNNGTYKNNEFADVYIVHTDTPISGFKMNDGEVQEVKYIDIAEFAEWVKSGKENVVSHPEEYALLFEYLAKNSWKK